MSKINVYVDGIHKDSLDSPRFKDLICELKWKDYCIMEANISYDTVYIIFNHVYEFENIPHGFDIMDRSIGNCDDCEYGLCCHNTPCNNYTEPKTILVYSDFNSNFTDSQLDDILTELTAWVHGIHCPYIKERIGRIIEIAV